MVGWIWTATGTHFNGLISTSKGLSFADLGTDPILAAAKVPGAGIWQMIFAIGALEVYWEGKYPSYECAGNFGVPAVTSDPAKLKELQTIELKHGRCTRRAARRVLFAAARVSSFSFAHRFFSPLACSGNDRHHLVRQRRRHPGLGPLLSLLN